MVFENKELDVVTDIIIPAIIVTVLFLINGVILYIILRKRRNVVYEQYNTNQEEPAASQPFCAETPQTKNTEDTEAGIEMQRL